MTCAEISPALYCQAPQLCLGCRLMLNTSKLWRYFISIAQEIGSAPVCAHISPVGELKCTGTPEPAEPLDLQRCFVRLLEHISSTLACMVSPPAVV